MNEAKIHQQLTILKAQLLKQAKLFLHQLIDVYHWCLNCCNSKISIIMPVYNASPYLRQCLDSVVAQSFTNFEIICIDDASSDVSWDILNDYATKDKRFILCRNTSNSGAGFCRNLGMQKAKGKYLYFMDADDFLLPDALLHMQQSAEHHHADIVVGKANILGHLDDSKDDYYGLKAVPYQYFHHTTNISELKNLAFKLNFETWNKLYRHDFIRRNNFHFQTLPSVNDVYFHLVTLVTADKIYIIDEIVYYYRLDSLGSVSKRGVKNLRNLISAFTAAENYLMTSSDFSDFKYGFKAREIGSYLYCLYFDPAVDSSEFVPDVRQRLQALDQSLYSLEHFQNYPWFDKMLEILANK